MPMFRKKPVVIEARQVPDVRKNPENAVAFQGVAIWCGGEACVDAVDDYCILINTLEGQMKAVQGDWIIKGVSGEFYPCKPDIFAKTYEKAEGAA